LLCLFVPIDPFARLRVRRTPQYYSLPLGRHRFWEGRVIVNIRLRRQDICLVLAAPYALCATIFPLPLSLGLMISGLGFYFSISFPHNATNGFFLFTCGLFCSYKLLYRNGRVTLVTLQIKFSFNHPSMEWPILPRRIRDGWLGTLAWSTTRAR